MMRQLVSVDMLKVTASLHGNMVSATLHSLSLIDAQVEARHVKSIMIDVFPWKQPHHII